jgi:hypothetical protein
MTDATLTIVLVAIVPTLAAIGAMIVSIINAIKSTENGAKADHIIEKATEIHTLTNSNLSKVTATLDVANAKIEGMQKMISGMLEAKNVADHLADKTASAPVVPSADPVEVKVINPKTDPVIVKEENSESLKTP